MLGLSGGEILFIALIALIVLGPEKLLVTARKAGQVMGEVRKVSAGFEAEMRTAMFEPDPPAAAPTPPTDTDRRDGSDPPALEPGPDGPR